MNRMRACPKRSQALRLSLKHQFMINRPLAGVLIAFVYKK